MSSSTPQQHLMLISRQAPYGGDKAQLCLDIGLAASIFEQRVSYVFIDDGVYQLLKEQNGKPITQKNFGAGLETLELYGIEDVYVDEASLATRKLTVNDLVITPKLVSNEGLAQLMASCDKTISL